MAECPRAPGPGPSRAGRPQRGQADPSRPSCHVSLLHAPLASTLDATVARSWTPKGVRIARVSPDIRLHGGLTPQPLALLGHHRPLPAGAWGTGPICVSKQVNSCYNPLLSSQDRGGANRWHRGDKDQSSAERSAGVGPTSQVPPDRLGGVPEVKARAGYLGQGWGQLH